jgi:uncharacterized protein YjbI with pentapeptide repeats
MTAWRIRERIVIFKIIELGVAAVAHLVAEHIPEQKKTSTEWNPEDTRVVLTTQGQEGVDLRRANLSGQNLALFKFMDANLEGANLRDANLKGANLDGANLAGANLAGANLQDAKLRGANLAGAYLVGARLRNARCNNADFTGAERTGADLTGANFKGAKGLP